MCEGESERVSVRLIMIINKKVNENHKKHLHSLLQHVIISNVVNIARCSSGTKGD